MDARMKTTDGEEPLLTSSSAEYGAASKDEVSKKNTPKRLQSSKEANSTTTTGMLFFQSFDDQHPAIFWDNFSTAMWLITDILWAENNSLAVCIAPFVVVGYAKAFFSFKGEWERYAIDLARTMALCFWILANTVWLFQELTEEKRRTRVDATFMMPYNAGVILTLLAMTVVIEPGIFLYYRSRGINCFEMNTVLKPIGNMGITFWAAKDFAWYLADEEMLREEYRWIPKVAWVIADGTIMFQLFPLFFKALQGWGIFSCFSNYASYKQKQKTFMRRFAHVIDELAMTSWAVSMTLWSFGEIFMPEDTFAQKLAKQPNYPNLRWWCGHVLIFGGFPFFVKTAMEVFMEMSCTAKSHRRRTVALDT